MGKIVFTLRYDNLYTVFYNLSLYLSQWREECLQLSYNCPPQFVFRKGVNYFLFHF